jgi:hypothetical protein
MDPVYEYKDDQPRFRILILLSGVMFLAMAVFFPMDPHQSPAFNWGMRIFFVAMAVLVYIFTPVISLRAFDDYIEVRYGLTKLISLNFPFTEIINIYPVEYHAIRDFGGWGIKYGVGKWKGWTAYTATPVNKALGIETHKRNYIISCPNPEEASSILRNLLHITKPPEIR